MRTPAVVLVVLLTGCLDARAQSPPPPSAVSFVAGAGATWDDESQIGTGPVAGAAVERRLAGHTSVALEVDWLRHERTGRFAAEGRTILVTGAIVQRFGDAAAQPYLLGGVALAHHTGTAGFPEIGQITSTSSTDAGFTFGGGVAVRVGSRVEVGPEARFCLLQADEGPAPAYAYWVGGRIGIRF